MKLDSVLLTRSGGVCELCTADKDLAAFVVGGLEQAAAICAVCRSQIEGSDELHLSHWHCLKQSVWSTDAAVQVLSYRMLRRLAAEPWAQELLDTVYLDDEVQAIVDADARQEQLVATLDSNGAVLQAGDTVTLIKDLDVKGTGFTAKRGTAVRNIALSDNPEHIEGRVNGTRIVIISKFVKRAS